MSVRCEPPTVLCRFHLRSYRGTKHSRGTSTPACLMRTPAVKNYNIGTVYVLSSGMYLASACQICKPPSNFKFRVPLREEI